MIKPAPATLALLNLSFNNLHDQVAQNIVEKYLPNGTRLTRWSLATPRRGAHARFEANNLSPGMMQKLAPWAPPLAQVAAFVRLG